MISELVLGFAMLGVTGAWAVWNVPRAYRWLTRKDCLHCGKPKLVADPANDRDGAARIRCRLCRAEYYHHDGELIGRAAFEAGWRDQLAPARTVRRTGWLRVREARLR